MKKKLMKIVFPVIVVITVISCQTETKENTNVQKETDAIENSKIHTLPDLEFEYTALEPHIDSRTLKIHHGKHHQAYVNNFNSAIKGTDLEKMAMEDIFKDISEYPTAVRNHGGGHYNHAMYWKMLSPDGGGQPSGVFFDQIEKNFGSFDEFREEFSTAAASVFGSGWTWLIVDEDDQLKVTNTPNQDNPFMDIVDERGIPIMVIDIWEHAYYLDYQNRRQEYIEEFWNVINWPEVERRYKGAIEN